MNEHMPELHTDVLRGADQIAVFLFGHREQRRKVYHLAPACLQAWLDDLRASLGSHGVDRRPGRPAAELRR